jgi:hypothetical protein
MAKVILDPIAVRRTAQVLTKPKVQKMVNDTVALSKRWPRAGNPAWTNSYGELNRATTGRVFQDGGDWVGVVENDKSYAMVVHEGGRARIIRARNGQFMKFRWKRFGDVLTFLEVVKHPKTKGSKFITGPMRVIANREGFRTTTNIQG